MMEKLKACENCGCESILPVSPHVQLFYNEYETSKMRKVGISIVGPAQLWKRADRWFYCTECNRCCFL
jgi:hypothetical protein